MSSIVTAWDRCRPGSTPPDPALWTVRPNREDIRLSTRHRVFIDLTENELVDAIEPKRSYQILGPDRKIAAVAEARYCCMLAHRKLIIGTARVKENRRELTSLRIAPRATVGQIKGVMRLKPPRVQIANAATVVKVLPQTYTHRDSLPVEREYDRLKLSIAAGRAMTAQKVTDAIRDVICEYEVVYADTESAPETIQLAPLTYYDELVPSFPPERWAELGFLPCRRLLPAGAPDAERHTPDAAPSE